MKKIIASILVIIAGFLGYQLMPKGTFGKESYDFQRFSGDVVGTHIGTSTVGVAFRQTSTGGQTATSTYISKIGNSKNNAVYTVITTAASSSSNVMMHIMGSNDDFCDSTATSTLDAACVGDCVLASQINWFSAGDHFKGKSQTTNPTGASSTSDYIITNPTVGQGGEIILEDLNYQCLRLGISGSSTIVYVGISTK